MNDGFAPGVFLGVLLAISITGLSAALFNAGANATFRDCNRYARTEIKGAVYTCSFSEIYPTAEKK